MTISIANSAAARPRPATPARFHSLAKAVGNTPTVWLDDPYPDPGRGFWAKLEGFNPGGIKDRPGLHMVERARARGDLRPGGADHRVHQRHPRPRPRAGRHGLRAPRHPGHRPGPRAVHDPAAHRLRRRTSTWSPSRTPPAAGSRPAATGSPQLLAAARRRLVPGPVQQPRQHRRLHPARPRTGHRAGPHRRAGVQRRHRRPLRGHLRASCGSSTPDLPLVGVDTVGSTIFGQPARHPADARARLQHLPAQRRLRHLRRGALGRPGRSRLDLPPAGRAPTTPPAAGASARSRWSPAGWPGPRPPDTRIAAVFPDGPQRYLGHRLRRRATAPRTDCSAGPGRPNPT